LPILIDHYAGPFSNVTTRANLQVRESRRSMH